jgi:hypothetical protein
LKIFHVLQKEGCCWNRNEQLCKIYSEEFLVMVGRAYKKGSK